MAAKLLPCNKIGTASCLEPPSVHTMCFWLAVCSCTGWARVTSKVQEGRRFRFQMSDTDDGPLESSAEQNTTGKGGDPHTEI